MGLEWLPRDHELKNHALHSGIHWSKQAPSVIYEKRPLTFQFPFAGFFLDSVSKHWAKQSPQMLQVYKTSTSFWEDFSSPLDSAQGVLLTLRDLMMRVFS